MSATTEETRYTTFKDFYPFYLGEHSQRLTRRLLGAQIIGREGAAKRIDVMAAAIWNEMTVDEFAQLDLGYAPPFSPVWDPTIIAARRAADALN